MSNTERQAASSAGASNPAAASNVGEVFRLSPPEKFDCRDVQNWPKWIRRFERYRVVSGLDKREEAFQVNTLIYSMGDESEDILNASELTSADKLIYKKVKECFDEHFIGEHNIIFERAKFNMRKQEQGETAESFITAVHKQADYCKFGALRDELIRDRIVVGIRDATLSEKLQMDAKLTLTTAVTRVRQSETVKQQQGVLRGASGPVSIKEPSEEMHALSLARKTEGSAQQRQKQNRYATSSACHKCGRAPSHNWKDCPAKEAECRKCHKRGHFAVVCKSKQPVHEMAEEEGLYQDSLYLGEVKSDSTGWFSDVKLNGAVVSFKLDTGAAVTAIPTRLYSYRRDGPLLHTPKKLYGPNNTRLSVVGQIQGSLESKDKKSCQPVFVIDNLARPLLGLPALTALRLVERMEKIDTLEENGDPERKFKKKFPKVFTGLGRLEGDYRIRLREDAVPYALTTPRRVPIPLTEKVKEELKRMEEMGVISRIEKPTEWCAGIVVVPKPNGKIRLCVDLTKLNESVCRERHILPSVDHSLAQLNGAKFFTKLDARSGFWQIPLAQESRELTTFITPFGRFCFNVLPFGINSGPEHFQRRMSQLLAGLEGVICHADDVLVSGNNEAEHDERLTAVLTRLQEAGLTLNEKCTFAQSETLFVGHKVSAAGVEPDPEKIRAITDMPVPENAADVRRFLGMVTYVAKFLPHFADSTKPLRDLLGKGNEWTWSHMQQTAFDKLKNELASPTVLAQYRPQAKTKVSADASSFGLGAVLMQREENMQWRPVAYISRSLSDTEQRYAQVEKEALAVTWACERLSSYLIGLQFTIETDHKPLLALLGTKALDDLPPRIQRFRLRLLRFIYNIIHVPGKALITADTLSRAPIRRPLTAEETQMEGEVQIFINAVRDNLPASQSKLQQIGEHQRQDAICSQLIRQCQRGWPRQEELSQQLKPYWEHQGELHMNGDLLMKGRRIVIPETLQNEMLARLHEGHMGVSKCKLRAQQSVWWLGLSAQITKLVSNCETCLKYQQLHPEPMIPSELPKRPWQKVGADMFYWENDSYLLVVDYYSRYIEIMKTSITTSAGIINGLKSIFARHGVPDFLISDNGPQFSSASFSSFATDYDFRHVTSSPYFAQSNGEAERAVKTVKSLLKKNTDPYKALLAYRVTPLNQGPSPAELLMGRRLRSPLPLSPSQLKPQWPNQKKFADKDKELKQAQALAYNKRHRAGVRPELQAGQRVWITNTQEPATVLREADTPRSYVVETDTEEVRRNKAHLRPLPDIQGPTQNVGDTEQTAAPELRVEENEERVHPRREVKAPAWLKDYVQ